MEKGLKKYIGTKQFYRNAFIIIAPIILQQLFLSVAGYVDSLMINAYGGVGDYSAYNGVSAANRLFFVINFIFIGFSAASSIFISQYFGAKNKGKILESYNLSLVVSLILSVVSFLVAHFFGDAIINAFITDPVSRAYGYDYLHILKWGLPFVSFSASISSAFRSVQQPVLPMICGITGIVINVVLNYLLIFGNFGFPELASSGAAIATAVSRFIEFAILVFFAVFWKKSYFKDFLHAPKITKSLCKSFLKRGLPLVLNETAWSTGLILFALFYTYKNDVWYNAYGYAQNISDLFFIFFTGLGNGTAIILGPLLGANQFDRARQDANRMKGLAVMVGVFMGVLMVLTAPYIVLLFQPNEVTKKIVIDVLSVTAIFIPIYSFNACSFFILRSGGDSVRAFSLDQLPTYFVALPITIILGVNASAWGLTLPFMFLCSHASDVIKVCMAIPFVKKEKWLFNLTTMKQKPSEEAEARIEEILRTGDKID